MSSKWQFPVIAVNKPKLFVVVLIYGMHCIPWVYLRVIQCRWDSAPPKILVYCQVLSIGPCKNLARYDIPYHPTLRRYHPTPHPYHRSSHPYHPASHILSHHYNHISHHIIHYSHRITARQKVSYWQDRNDAFMKYFESSHGPNRSSSIGFPADNIPSIVIPYEDMQTNAEKAFRVRYTTFTYPLLFHNVMHLLSFSHH